MPRPAANWRRPPGRNKACSETPARGNAMLNPDERQAVTGNLRALQIITLALVAGPLAFLGVVLLQTPPEEPNQNLVMIGLGFAALQIVVAIVIPQVIGAQQRTAIVEGRPITHNQVALVGDAASLMQSF